MNNSDYDYPDIMEMINDIEDMKITDATYEFKFSGIKISGINTHGGRQFAIHQTLMGRQGSGQYYTNKDDVYLDLCILLEKN